MHMGEQCAVICNRPSAGVRSAAMASSRIPERHKRVPHVHRAAELPDAGTAATIAGSGRNSIVEMQRPFAFGMNAFRGDALWALALFMLAPGRALSFGFDDVARE